MAKAKGPRIRKVETPGKLDRARKNQKERAGRARGKISSPLSAFIGFFAKGLKWIIPGFLSGAFSEIRQTSWPDRSETIRLTWAVFVFAIVFSIIVASLDFVLGKIFRSIILG